jgi:hypothetical protein
LKSKDAQKNKLWNLKKSALCIILGLSTFLSSCSSRLNAEKPTIPQVVKESAVQTYNRFQTQIEAWADYWAIFDQKLKDRSRSELEETQDRFTYAKKRMLINSLADYSSLTRGEEMNFEMQEEIEDLFEKISKKSFQDAFDKFDFVIAFKKDMRGWFYRGRDVNNSDEAVNKNSADFADDYKLKVGFKPDLEDMRALNFRVPITLENAFWVDKTKIEPGTDFLKARLAQKLDENVYLSLKYYQKHNLLGYEGEDFEDKKREVTATLSVDILENLRLSLDAAYIREKEKGCSTHEGYSIGLGFICLSK